MPVPSSKNPEEREFALDSRAVVHVLSKMDPSSAELETLRKSRNPITVVTADGKVQTSGEAQVYVHDLELFMTVQLLEDTRDLVSDGDDSLSRSMMIKAKNALMKERIWIDRVASEIVLQPFIQTPALRCTMRVVHSSRGTAFASFPPAISLTGFGHIGNFLPY